MTRAHLTSLLRLSEVSSDTSVTFTGVMTPRCSAAQPTPHSHNLTHTTSDHLQREFRGIYGPDVSGWTSSYMFMIGTFGSDEGFGRLYRLKEFNTSLSFLSYGLLVWNSVTELHGGLAAVRGVNLHCRRLLHPSAELNWEQQIQSPVSQNVSCIRKGSISASTNGRVRIVLREGTDFKCNYKCGVTQ